MQMLVKFEPVWHHTKDKEEQRQAKEQQSRENTRSKEDFSSLLGNQAVQRESKKCDNQHY